MTDSDVSKLLERPEIAAMDPAAFSDHTPLKNILLNDTSIVKFSAGDIVVRESDYGNSAFLILSVDLLVFIGD